MDLANLGVFPPHQSPLDRWVPSDTSDAYTPMADGLRLLSNGYGFYEAFSVPPYALPKPQTAPVHHNIEYHPELKIEFDQYPITRFFSPGELSTPPDTPASMVASPPPPPPPFPPPSTALSMQAEPKWWCPTPLSNEDARQRIGAYIPSARWFENNMPEPLVGDADVPACAQLLARRGESIYRCFVDTRKGQKGKSVYYCTECGFMSDRLHRLLGHQRSKRGHRPFACPDEGCDFRGYSAESLGDHRSSRNSLHTCEICRDTIVKKNLARHLQVVHAQLQ